MPTEVRNVRQIAGESKRRWFTDGDMDLTVWLNDRQEIVGFQLCYDKSAAERALTWKQASGFLHNRVDDGEGRPGRHKGTPILIPDGLFKVEKIAGQFLSKSRHLEPELSTFVYHRLLEYPSPR